MTTTCNLSAVTAGTLEYLLFLDLTEHIGHIPCTKDWVSYCNVCMCLWEREVLKPETRVKTSNIWSVFLLFSIKPAPVMHVFVMCKRECSVCVCVYVCVCVCVCVHAPMCSGGGGEPVHAIMCADVLICVCMCACVSDERCTSIGLCKHPRLFCNGMP